jgi:hypothetical protein
VAVHHLAVDRVVGCGSLMMVVAVWGGAGSVEGPAFTRFFLSFDGKDLVCSTRSIGLHHWCG